MPDKPEVPVVRISRKGTDRLHSGHLWVFASDVVDRGSASPGDVVRVVEGRNRALGSAHYSSTSQITLRLLTRSAESIDNQFIRRRFTAALQHRQKVVGNATAYRLIHAEGDLLPGLIVDRYGDYLVMQMLDQGMDRMAALLLAELSELLQPKAVIARNDVTVRAKEDLPQESTVLAGELPRTVEVTVNGLRWQADLLEGQKTGIFLDQRENYLAVQQYAHGRALDCFTATGGFALHCASVCEHVEAVDSSSPTLATARRNAELNGLGGISFVHADVLDLLPNLISARRIFDTVIVDPPAFAKSRSALEGAARGYKEINLRAMRLLQRGGILVSCSCSHHLSEAQLLEIIAAASLDAGKQVRILERRTQSRDHPILLTVPETHYLKCLICEVI